MKSIKPSAVAGCLVAVLASFAQTTAAATEMTDESAKSTDNHPHVLRAVSESGRFQCSLAAVHHLGRAMVTAGTLGGRAVVEFGNWQSEHSEIRVHRSVLHKLSLQRNVPVAHDSDANESYLRFSGSKITAQNDSIVESFENNALVTAEQRKSSLQSQIPHFSGFKAYLGRHTELEADGRNIEADVYFRIIVDWSYQSRRQDELSLHRAAFVISQVPIGAGAGGERFYRFLPSRSPFRMVACVLGDARVI